MSDDAARTTARILLEVGAVDFRPDEPFTHTSGRVSPSYIDCRRLIAYPRARAKVTALAVGLIERAIGFESLDAIAGGETAGIPFAAWIADALALPMLYVRKQPKGFGRMAQIEGVMAEGAAVLLVEDLATDGATKARFVEAIRHAGGVIDHAYVVFHYGIFAESAARLDAMGVRLHALATWWDVLAVAREEARFPAAVLAEVEAYLNDPAAWSTAREQIEV